MKKISMILFEDEQDFNIAVSRIITSLEDYEINYRCTDIVTIDDSNQKIIKRYIASCYISGLSPFTIKHYLYAIRRFLQILDNKPITSE